MICRDVTMRITKLERGIRARSDSGNYLDASIGENITISIHEDKTTAG